MSEMQDKPSCDCGVSVDKALVLFIELKRHMQRAEKWGLFRSKIKVQARFSERAAGSLIWSPHSWPELGCFGSLSRNLEL